MPSAQRERACLACASSKRSCDKTTPECQRCLDRDLDCIYPQPKRRRRDRAAQSNANVEAATSVPDVFSRPALERHDYGEVGHSEFDAFLADIAEPLTTVETVARAPNLTLEPPSLDETPCPWFLEETSWTLEHNYHESACETDFEAEPFIQTVRDMLVEWTQNGHNSFIHRHLYDRGMPKCLQDAFTTLAAYNSRTPAVKETILQIAEERSWELISLLSDSDGITPSLKAQMARVQALLVYVFIRLFDGSIRLRASAERQLPTLRSWVGSIWQTAKVYQGEDVLAGNASSNELDSRFSASLSLWKLWIVVECVRRTQVLADTLANVYETMTRGWAECTGAAMLTARRDLWEAVSAVKWFDLTCAKPPLLVSSVLPEPWISQYEPREVDDFVKVCWTLILGKDKVRCWIDSGNTSSSGKASIDSVGAV